jgi:hypothetical protein
MKFARYIPSYQCVLVTLLHHGLIVVIAIAAPSPALPSLPFQVLPQLLSAPVLSGLLHPTTIKP